MFEPIESDQLSGASRQPSCDCAVLGESRISKTTSTKDSDNVMHKHSMPLDQKSRSAISKFALMVAGTVLLAACGGGLSLASTCSEYLAAPEPERIEMAHQVMVEAGVQPIFQLQNIDANCAASNSPDVRTLADVVRGLSS